MAIVYLHSEAFPICHDRCCDPFSTWGRDLSPSEIEANIMRREACFDARHTLTHMIREEYTASNYDPCFVGGHSFGHATRRFYAFEAYAGCVVATGTDHNVRIMSDVWGDIDYAIVFDVRTLAFHKIECDRMQRTVDAPEWLIAAYRTMVALTEMATRHRMAAADRQREADRVERERNTPRKGRTVRVVKGRKVPKGTEGIVVWYGEGKRYSYYGESPMRVGIKDASGMVHYTAATNVQVIHA